MEDVPEPEPEPEPAPAPAPEPAPAPAPATEENDEPVPAPVPQPVPVKKAAIKASDETNDTTALKDLILTHSLTDLLPDEVLENLPDGVSTVAQALTQTLENYDESMGAVTLSFAVKKTYTKGEKASVVIALPDGNGGYLWFTVEGFGQEDGTLGIILTADIAKVLAGKTFVTLIME